MRGEASHKSRQSQNDDEENRHTKLAAGSARIKAADEASILIFLEMICHAHRPVSIQLRAASFMN